MSERSVVTVRGDASLRTRPDEAQMHLEVGKVDRHADDAHADVARRSRALDALLEELEVPAERRRSTGVSVRPEHSWSGSRWERKGWRASNGIALRLQDPTIVGRLVGEAVDRAEAAVSGPWWSVTPEHPSRTEVCAEAARRARAKAEAYATALGLRLGEVLEIREPGTGHGEEGGPRAFVTPVAAQAAPVPFAERGAPAPPPTIDVDPGEVEVHGSVEVTFALEA